MSRTRNSISEPLKALKRRKINEPSLYQLEENLIASDVGINATEIIIDKLSNNKTDDPIRLIKEILLTHLPDQNIIPVIPPKSIVFLIGVNGTGKTTTTAKLANLLSKQNLKIFMVGADTYRVAAAEQLEEWARRLNMNIVCNAQSGDPSAVLFDGLKSAQKNNSDVVIVDTAGRLHTYKNLMAELEKMVRIVNRHYPEFNIISLLTIDANIGQNSLIQAHEFTRLFKIDGVILTKMDGTAKGGIVFPLYDELKIPVMYIGVGEKLDDLLPFNANEYIKSIIGIDEQND
ncbi:MAG: signal recognition particle-docking protein FtsY [Candidatus Marinimicrobia bacterium]|nr:signal recognition particle-docking protein FtsY [Candidatus Neomarinimicrobiota bacterium]